MLGVQTYCRGHLVRTFVSALSKLLTYGGTLLRSCQ